MNETDKKVVSRFRELLQRRLSLHSIVVFGSRARGEAASDSDLDVLVVINEPDVRTARRYASNCAWEAGFEEGIIIVPVVVSRESWEQGPGRFSLLAQAIREEGVAI